MKIYHDLIRFFGTQQKTAVALRVRQGTVAGWASGRHGMSLQTAVLAEEETGGRFTVKDLCLKRKERSTSQ